MGAAPLTFHKNAVGYSSWHRRWIKGQHEGAASVPCGDCTVCCRSFDEIPLTKGFDDFAAYRTRPSQHYDVPVLEKNADGSCVHLVDGACSVYSNRPFTCRTFDCRIYHTLSENSVAHLPPDDTIKVLRETAQRRFAFVTKEPDDHTFITRLNAAVQKVQEEQPDASVPRVLITALVKLAPKALAKLEW
jgi:Fe-S-cluster containining protein